MATIAERLKRLSGCEETGRNIGSGDTIRNPTIVDFPVHSDSMSCELSCVQSPSSFWLRFPNHITDSTLTANDVSLEPAEALTVGEFVMAPQMTPKGVMMRRAQVIKVVHKELKMLLVFYIDVGSRAWVAERACFLFPVRLGFHPKQVVLCTLALLEPKVGASWTEEMTAAFRELIEGKKLKANVLIDPEARNNENKPKTVVLCVEQTNAAGITECPEVALTLSLRHRALFKCNKVPSFNNVFPHTETISLDHPPSDLLAWQLECSSSLNIGARQHIISVNPTYRQRLPEPEMIWVGADPTPTKQFRGPQIPTVTVEDLKIQATGEMWVSVASAVTPHEFYVSALDDEDGQDQLEEIIDQKKEQLERFYNEHTNRVSIPFHRLTALDDAQPVYGVAERTDGAAEYTGRWQRVQLLATDYEFSSFAVARAARRNHAETLTETLDRHGGQLIKFRWIDSGGTDKRPVEQVYELDEQFTTYPPLAIPCCLRNLEPTDPTWSHRAQERFKKLMRTDMSLKVFIETFEISEAGICPRLDLSPKKYPGVLSVLSIESEQSGKPCLVQQALLEEGHARNAQ